MQAAGDEFRPAARDAAHDVIVDGIPRGFSGGAGKLKERHRSCRGGLGSGEGGGCRTDEQRSEDEREAPLLDVFTDRKLDWHGGGIHVTDSEASLFAQRPP